MTPLKATPNHLRPPFFHRAVLAAALSLFVSSCGGGGHGGGIGGTGIVFGAISGFGSVIVNDVEFDTSTAVVTRDGEPATASQLGLGMIVTVEGQLDADRLTGVADTIEVTTLLEGPLETVASDLATASVLGGNLVFGPDTVVEDLTLSDTAAVGKNVEVSGFVDANGNIRVTRIAGSTSIVDSGFAVRGVIENVDTIAETFTIRGVTISYAMAELSDVPAGGVVDGLEVRTIIIDAPINRLATAMSVRFFTRAASEDTDRIVKLEGIVTARIGARRFVLGGRRVFRVTDTTRIIGGVAADLGPDVAVGIVGVLEDTGIVRAERIEIRGRVATVPGAPAEPVASGYIDSF